MEEIALTQAELLSLLDQLEIDRPLGVEAEQLPNPQAFEEQELLQQGINSLLDRGLLTRKGDDFQVEDKLSQILETITGPKAVVKTLRETYDEPDFWSWHYVTDSSIVGLSFFEGDQYQLAKLTDLESIVMHLENVFPLKPVPDAIHYQTTVLQEDADEIGWLADGWREAPALDILEADGMEKAGALRFYDDIEDYQWRGRVDLMACDRGKVTTSHRVLLLQGQEGAWVAGQTKPGVSTLHIQTAATGDFERLLAHYWQELGF